MNFLKLFFSRHRVPHVHFAEPSNLDYDYITDGIYVGTNQCCTMGLSDVLKKEGITADISLEEKKLDQPFGVETYTWLPTPNHLPPTPDKLSFGVAAIENMVSQGKKVYVHCQNGHGRAPTLVAAYLIKNKGMTPEAAFTFIKSKRKSTHLSLAQTTALEVFAKALA